MLQMRHDLVQQPEVFLIIIIIIMVMITTCIFAGMEKFTKPRKTTKLGTMRRPILSILVANLLKESLGRVQDNIADHEEAETTAATPASTAIAIANIMSSLYYAEFAFVIMTPTFVFYGHDSWERIQNNGARVPLVLK
jgi:hypothetical protein